MIEILKSAGKECSACGACYNICPKKAINMVADKEGFIVPKIEMDKCVHCLLCRKVCPVLHPQYKNDSHPVCYAVQAQSDICKVSSSGGAFSVFADEILKNDGFVFGAAWDTATTVKQVAINTPDDLAKLRGSKYVQGDAADSYLQVKDLLKSGKHVFYTGLPCQIAGLYAVLGNCDKKNLLTMELCCHGVTNSGMLEKYLRDKFPDKCAKSVSFRDKRNGWGVNVAVKFDDDSEFFEKSGSSSWWKAFNPLLFMRKSCGQCSFAKLPRQADITVGDFWGCDPSINNHQGLSFVLLNNKRARQFFSKVSTQFQFCQKTTLQEITKINKTILHPFHLHSGRKHFFSSIENKKFAKLVDNSLNHRYDIGLVGLWYGINYGSILTYYALYQFLKDCGYDPVLFPKPNCLWEGFFNDPSSISQKFMWQHCNVFLPFVNDFDAVTVAQNNCKDFIVGSDVVWSHSICGKQSSMYFFLDFVGSHQRKIAFACSSGKEDLEKDTNYTNTALSFLRTFHGVAVREAPLRDFLQKNRIPDAVQVCDPVFICDPKHFYSLISPAADSQQENYIFAYVLSPSERVCKTIQFVEQHLSSASKICLNPYKNSKGFIKGENLFSKHLPILSVEEWLTHMYNCKFYIGTSFHGICFALLFHKPFLALKGKKRTIRIESLLEYVGLSDRYIVDENDWQKKVENVMDKPIDWDRVDEKIAQWKHFSAEWLKKTLHTPLRINDDQDAISITQHYYREMSRHLAMVNREKSAMSLLKDIKHFIKYCREYGLRYTLMKLKERL